LIYGKQIDQIVDLLAVEPDKVFHTIHNLQLTVLQWLNSLIVD